PLFRSVVDVPAGTVAQHGVADRALRGPGQHLGVVALGRDLRPGQRSVQLDARHVGVAHLVGELGGMGGGALQLEAAGVAQRGLVAVVPADPAAPLPLRGVQQRVRPDHEMGQQDRAARAGTGAVLEIGVDHPELGVETHHPLGGQRGDGGLEGRDAHAVAPSSPAAAVPAMSGVVRVRPCSGTTASTRRRPPPGRPETRAQSSGWAAEGMSSFSTNSVVIASRRCWAATPTSPVASWSLTASFFARSTMLRSVAPETKSRKWRVSEPPSEYSTRTKAEAGLSS